MNYKEVFYSSSFFILNIILNLILKISAFSSYLFDIFLSTKINEIWIIKSKQLRLFLQIHSIVSILKLSLSKLKLNSSADLILASRGNYLS